MHLNTTVALTLSLVVVLSMFVGVIAVPTKGFTAVSTRTESVHPSVDVNETYGGDNDDFGVSLVQTMDGGFVIAGTTRSFGEGGADAWLVKVGSDGTEQWNRTFGGSDRDQVLTVAQTDDGGYILAGFTTSFGTGNQSPDPRGNWQAWLVKIASNGTEQWNRTYGGIDREKVHAVNQTADGGYILAGQTESFGAGAWDAWLIEVDANGTEEWNQTFGGGENDAAHEVTQTEDSGYLFAGETKTTEDAWLVKVDSNGSEEWSQTYGGSGTDRALDFKQTPDGGYVFIGETTSFGAGGDDAWLVKVGSSGTKHWHQTYGGDGHDRATASDVTADGGFILGGDTDSFGAGGDDAWLVKVSLNGTEQWNQTYGGGDTDQAQAVMQTTDKGYAFAGRTNSFGAGNIDALLVKVGGIDTSINLNDTEGLSGTNVTVGLQANASDVSNYQANITFNESAVEVVKTKGTENFSDPIANVSNEQGWVFISSARTTGVDDPILATITFHINESANGMTPLRFVESDTVITNTSDDNIPLGTYDDGSIVVANASIQVEEVSAAAGKAVNVTLSADVDAMYGYDANITFDPSVLEVTEVTNLQSGLTVTTVIDNESGYVSISGAGVQAVGPDPELAEITFQVNGSASPGEYALAFERSETSLYDGQGRSISIEYDGGHVNVQQCKIGDANGDESVNAGDAVVILRYSAGQIESLSVSKNCANANDDGSINAGDAVVILRFSAGQIEDLPPN